ncbi:sigma factor [Nocardia amikacinitolerans]|uniref:sigma factor n=1 Tax=Nocardia amikacinitolerans TaxID=756689 RepID=UPI003555FC1A
MRDHDYAEETCHDVYLQVWCSAAGFDERLGSVTTWLRTLAHRKAVDRVRRERAASDRDQTWAAGDYGPPADHVAEEVLRRHEYRCVRTGLAALTPLQRESVLLAYYHDLTYPKSPSTWASACPLSNPASAQDSPNWPSPSRPRCESASAVGASGVGGSCEQINRHIETARSPLELDGGDSPDAVLHAVHRLARSRLGRPDRRYDRGRFCPPRAVVIRAWAGGSPRRPRASSGGWRGSGPP